MTEDSGKRAFDEAVSKIQGQLAYVLVPAVFGCLMLGLLCNSLLGEGAAAVLIPVLFAAAIGYALRRCYVKDEGGTDAHSGPTADQR